MPSIIDKISQTEDNAAQLKKQAILEARERIAAAEQERVKRTVAARDESRETLAAAAESAEAEGKCLAAQITAENATKADALCESAQKNTSKAVAYILERVTKA
ncbi:MAG: hypothetical protein RR232_04770 [Clostridia bacterium]